MDISILLEHLRQRIPLSPSDEAILTEHIRVHRYRKGQFVVQHGDVCRFESFVVRGCLKQYFSDEDGTDHVVMLATENWWIADLESFVNGTPARFNVECLEDSVLAQIDREHMEELYKQIPALERFFRVIIQRAYIASQQRLVENISMPARERYEQFIKRYPELVQRVPQYLIASYLGMSREFLSKIRR